MNGASFRPINGNCYSWASKLRTPRFGPRGHHRSHPWLNYEDYAQLLRASDVGILLMLSPHVSYPPLEMAAAGASVVTNVFSVKTAERLSGISRNILPVEPNVDAIVDGLMQAAQRATEVDGRSQSPINGVPHSWDEAFRDTLPAVLRMWTECQGAA